MEEIDLDQLMTQESDYEILASKRATKVPKKRSLKVHYGFCTFGFLSQLLQLSLYAL
jgi:hypothetical protein